MRPQTAATSVFFFNDTATTEIYTLSLHDALPICRGARAWHMTRPQIYETLKELEVEGLVAHRVVRGKRRRSEEHTSELQSPDHLVCRLLLEKKTSTNRYTCRLPLLNCSIERVSVF